MDEEITSTALQRLLGMVTLKRVLWCIAACVIVVLILTQGGPHSLLKAAGALAAIYFVGSLPDTSWKKVWWVFWAIAALVAVFMAFGLWRLL